ncbi:MAG: hypothetical protein OEM01_02445 [Desulfobulbaceae bacterium]|nr:hypothetical protein [Desulfobulbaceae bacterium]
MELPEYISKEEVQRVCNKIGISDWTKLTGASVDLKEARIIQEKVGGETTQIPVEEFRKGLEVELEHGLIFKDANITNNHPILTGKIVLAHLKEMLDYYLRLEVAELEGDLFKANNRGDSDKLLRVYKKLVNARAALCESEGGNK